MAMATDDEQMAELSTKEDFETAQNIPSPSNRYTNHKRTASGTVILTEDDDPIESVSSDELDEDEPMKSRQPMKLRQPIKPKLNLSHLKFYDYSQSPTSFRKSPENLSESPLAATQPVEDAEEGVIDDKDKKTTSERRASSKVMRTAEQAFMEGNDRALSLQKLKKRKSDSSHYHSKLLLTSPASKSAAGIKRSRTTCDKDAKKNDDAKDNEIVFKI